MGVHLHIHEEWPRHQFDNTRRGEHEDILAVFDIEVAVLRRPQRHFPNLANSEQESQGQIGERDHAEGLQSVFAHESANENQLRSMQVVQDHPRAIAVGNNQNVRSAIQARPDTQSLSSSYQEASAGHEIPMPQEFDGAESADQGSKR